VVEFDLFEVVVVELESGCGRIQAFRGGCGRARNCLWSNSKFWVVLVELESGCGRIRAC
jgi:hypothetical protein